MELLYLRLDPCAIDLHGRWCGRGAKPGQHPIEVGEPLLTGANLFTQPGQ